MPRPKCKQCGRRNTSNVGYKVIGDICSICDPSIIAIKPKREFSTSGLADVFRTDPTKSEARFERTLKALESDGFRFQRSIPVGPYVADFLDKENCIAIELDGYVHRESRQRAHDQRRDQFFAEQGIRTVRIPSSLALTDAGGLLKALKNSLPALRAQIKAAVSKMETN